MKKLTIWEIISFWSLYVLVPILYKLYFGNYPQSIKTMGDAPDAYMTKAAVIITVTLFLILLVICLMPIGNEPIIGVTSCSTLYYYTVIGLTAFFAIGAGVLHYYSVLTGATSGTAYSYFNLFFNARVLFLIFLFCKKDERNMLLIVASYFFLSILMHSRAGALQLGVFLVGFIFATSVNRKNVINKVSEINQKYRNNIKVWVILLVIVAPFAYEYSTTTRGSIAFDTSHSLTESIAARCSCLDEAGLALYAVERNKESKEIFDAKYGVLNQVCCIIDSSIPGDIFGGDIDPNQYYKTVVRYMSQEDAAKTYISMNLTFPVYMVLKYGYVGGIVLSSVLILCFYVWVIKIKNPIWKITLILPVMNEMLSYFDWVMVWREVLRVVLTVGVFMLITKYLRVRPLKMRMPNIKIKFWRRYAA